MRPRAEERVLWGSRGDADLTAPIAAAVHAVGVMELPVALALSAWPADVDHEQRLDLLGAAGLHVPGSAVVWALQHCWPTLPVVRMVAAVGPPPVTEIVAGLTRARHAVGPRCVLPDPGLLLPWARAHPELRVRGRLVGLADPERGATALSDLDWVMLAALRERPAGIPAVELTALGCAAVLTRGCAQTRLNTNPRLRPDHRRRPAAPHPALRDQPGVAMRGRSVPTTAAVARLQASGP